MLVSSLLSTCLCYSDVKLCHPSCQTFQQHLFVFIRNISLSARLNSCLEEMRNILGESVPEHIMIDAVIRHNFEHDKALNDVLNQQGKFVFIYVQTLEW